MVIPGLKGLLSYSNVGIWSAIIVVSDNGGLINGRPLLTITTQRAFGHVSAVGKYYLDSRSPVFRHQKLVIYV